jgi:hypothetical protein
MNRRPGRSALAAALCAFALAGCASGGLPRAPEAALPSDAVIGAGDPTRAAAFNTAYVFNAPSTLAGNPAEAARAAANFEYLAVEIPHGARYRGLNALLQPQLEAGRMELRDAIGIRADAPPQAVIDNLYAAHRALRASDTAAAEQILGRPVFAAGGPETLKRLAALPPMPKVGFAANSTQREIDRADRIDDFRGGPGGAGLN